MEVVIYREKKKNLGKKLTKMGHNNKIRRIWHDDEWNYSVSNIIAVLTDSKDGLAYWKKRIDKIENQGHSRTKRLCDTNKRDIKSNIW